MESRFYRFVCMSLLLFLLASCNAGEYGNSPVAPGTNPEDSTLLTAQVEDNYSGEGNHYLWAYYLIYFDEPGNTFEVVPVRNVESHWNILRWLEQTLCTNCVSITSFTNSGYGTKLIDLRIRHPFGIANFTGFDVRGIAMFNGSKVFPASGHTMPEMELGDGELLNEDGHTALYNSTTIGMGPDGLQGYIKGKFATLQVPNAMLNGFVRYISDDPLNTRNAFYAGDEITRTFDIKFPTGSFVFGYAVDASWAPPTNKPVTDPMADFPPEANCPEPWYISWADHPIGQGLTPQGGQVELMIDVYDWSGKTSHHSPIVEFPDLFDGQVSAVWDVDFPGYSRYLVTIENTKHAAVGQYSGLMSVEDNENDTAPDWLDLTAYLKFHQIVNPFENVLPVAYAQADPLFQQPDYPVHFTGDDSYDPDGGTITNYEWDWENDGIYDETGSDVYHEFSEVGTYYVQLRVTDDESSTDTLDNPLEIVISSNECPTAYAYADPNPQQINLPVCFDASDSWDPDGTIVLFEWDWENDGVYDEEGMTVEHSWALQDIYDVMLRVTDDLGCEDVLDAPLEILILEDTNECPTADAGLYPWTQTINLPVQFFDNGSFDPDGTLPVHEWDWDNDGIYDEEGAVLEHSWSTPGIYLVQYRVIDDDGCPDELDQPLEVEIVEEPTFPPVAMAKITPNPVDVCADIEYEDNGSYDPDGGSIVLWEWDLEDDGIFEVQLTEPTIVTWYYTYIGSHDVQMRVTDDEGMSDLLDVPMEVYVNDIPPTAVAESDKQYPLAGEMIALNGTGSYDNDCQGSEILSWEWDLNNDGIYDATGETNNASYVAEGTYPIQLRVTDDEGGQDTLDSPLQIVVENAPIPVDETPPWLKGGTADIATYGNYAYLSNGQDGIMILNISNPYNPQYLGWFNPSVWGTYGICVAGGYLYIATGQSGLYVYDISNPTAPVFVKNVMTTHIAFEVAVFGGYAYVTDGSSGVQVIDINPLNTASIVHTVPMDYASHIALDGNYLYASDSYDLDIIDISNPLLANVVATVPMPDVISDITASSGYAYVSDWFGGFKVVDVSPAEFASVVKTIGTGGYVLSVCTSGSYAYFTDSVSGVNIVDISNPPTASIINWLTFPNVYSNPRTIAITGDYVIAAWYDVAICDVNPPASAGIVSYIESTMYSLAVGYKDGYAYSINQDDMALQVIDVEPSNLAHYVTYIPLDNLATMHGYDVNFYSVYAFVTNGSSGLEVVDISNPETPSIASFIPTVGDATDIEISDGYAYVADYDAGLTIVDIDPLVSASVVKNVPIGFNAISVSVSSGYACVGTETGGMFIIDINPIPSAYIVKNVLVPDYTYSIDIQGGYAYLGSWTGLSIVDVNPPEDASVVKSMTTFATWGVEVRNGFLYTASDFFGLGIFDIDPAADAAYFDSFHPWGDGEPEDICLAGDYAYISEASKGLRIVKIF